MEMEETITQENSAAQELKLHPENVKQRQETYSSLTDLSGVDIFTNDFRGKMEQWKEKKDEEQEEILGDIFSGQRMRGNGGDEEIIAAMFREKEALTLSHDYSKENAGVSVLDIGLLLLAAMLVTALYGFFFYDKKKRRK